MPFARDGESNTHPHPALFPQQGRGNTSAQGGSPRFATTRWSVVLAAAQTAAPEFNDALTTLCSDYWYPLYAFVRRLGHGRDDALDLTQAFFACLLEKRYLRQADRARGRFRSFLLASLKHFIADERDRAHALKRGGAQSIVSLDALRDAEGRYALEPSGGLTPEQIYERRWALTLLDQVLASLRADCETSGKARVFERMKGFLLGDSPADSYAQAAADLEMSEAAVKVAAHRLRRRYAQILREQIASTVETEEEVEDEVRQLFAALG